MGQTASTIEIDKSNPKPAELTFATAAELEVNIDKVNGNRAQASSSVRIPAADDRNDVAGASEPEYEVTAGPGAKPKSKMTKEDEIDQENANQDLLAYLTIVGGNASHLPFTWRDDPQLGTTVSTLTSKEYAKKADAFIPCDIRIIGASSSTYDRTANVPIKDVSYTYLPADSNLFSPVSLTIFGFFCRGW